MGFGWESVLRNVVTAWPLTARRTRESAAGARIDELVERYRAEPERAGIAAAVVRNGTVIKARGYGVSNLELQPPVTTRTLFGIPVQLD